jgi:hypothetical protein
MKMNTRSLSTRVGAAGLIVTLSLVSLATVNGAQQSSATSPPATKSPDPSRLAQPGAEHKVLDALVGSWDVSGQCWAKVGENPQSISGTDTSGWVLGDRFVKSHAKGTKASQPFEGIGMMGYDNTKREYQSTWQDTECTAIKMDSGTYDASSKTFTFTGEFKNEKGETVRCRRLLEITSDDQHMMTSYLTFSGQPELKAAELLFKRTGTKAARR